MNADSFKYKEITDIILRSFYEVYNELGDGFLESVYENALYIVLTGALVRGNAKKGRHENDADHIFELYKYGGGYFVTIDNRLLSLSEKFFNEYFVTTIKPCGYEALF